MKDEEREMDNCLIMRIKKLKEQVKNLIQQVIGSCILAFTKNKKEKRITDLEKENAELKSEKGCEICTKFDEVKLTKAKKYIRQLLDFIKAKENGDGRHPTPFFYEEYEQFLKEIEK